MAGHARLGAGGIRPRAMERAGVAVGVEGIAVYRDGRRVASSESLAEALARVRVEGGFLWASLNRPSDAEVAELAEVFQLHPLAAEDVAQGNQRPKIERYDDLNFVVLRPARYLKGSEIVEFGEVHAFVAPGFVVTVQLGDIPVIAEVQREIESKPEVLRRGPVGVLHALIDRVVDDYAPVAAGIDEVLAEIEDQLFEGTAPDHDVARRIYLLSREAIAFQRATRPLLDALSDHHVFDQVSGLNIEIQRGLRDVVDHLIPLCERADSYRQLLQNALSVHMSFATQAREEQMAEMTQTTIDQSDAMKKISSWAAIIFAPSLVSGIYGMNFAIMPELRWEVGYPFAIATMLVLAGGLYVIFKRKDWL